MNERGISKILLLVVVVVVLAVAVLVGGFVIGVHVQRTDPVAFLQVNYKEYTDTGSGVSLRYPSTWKFTPHPEAHAVWMISPENDQITIIVSKTSAETAERSIAMLQTSKELTPLKTNGYEGFRGNDNTGYALYYLFKKMDAQQYIGLQAMIGGPTHDRSNPNATLNAEPMIQDTQKAEAMFMAILPTISVNQ